MTTQTREEAHKRHVALLAEAARKVAEAHRITHINGRLGVYGRFPRKRYYLR